MGWKTRSIINDVNSTRANAAIQSLFLYCVAISDIKGKQQFTIVCESSDHYI